MADGIPPQFGQELSRSLRNIEQGDGPKGDKGAGKGEKSRPLPPAELAHKPEAARVENQTLYESSSLGNIEHLSPDVKSVAARLQKLDIVENAREFHSLVKNLPKLDAQEKSSLIEIIIQKALKLPVEDNPGNQLKRLQYYDVLGQKHHPLYEPNAKAGGALALAFNVGVADYQVVQKVIFMLISSLVNLDLDPVLIASVLRGLARRIENMETEIKTIQKFILENGLQSHEDPSVASAAKEFLTAARQGQTQQVTATIVDADAGLAQQAAATVAGPQGISQSGLAGQGVPVPTNREGREPHVRNKEVEISDRQAMQSQMAMVVGAVGAARLIALFNQLGEDVPWPLLEAILNIDSALNMAYEDQPPKMNPHRIVIVTDRSALFPVEIARATGLDVAEIDPIHRIRMFYDKFRMLVQAGARVIYAILPDSRYWNSYQYAKYAARHFGNRVKVIDSHTFGMGLGLLVHDLLRVINRSKIAPNVKQVFEEHKTLIRYWVVPAKLERVRKRLWFPALRAKYEEDHPKMTLGDRPIIAFHNPIAFADIGNDLQDALDRLKGLAEGEINKNGLPGVIYVHYYNMFPEAKTLSRELKLKYPKLNVQVVASNDYLFQRLGAHVGICLK